jgi:hypothetical protein
MWWAWKKRKQGGRQILCKGMNQIKSMQAAGRAKKARGPSHFLIVLEVCGTVWSLFLHTLKVRLDFILHSLAITQGSPYHQEEQLALYRRHSLLSTLSYLEQLTTTVSDLTLPQYNSIQTCVCIRKNIARDQDECCLGTTSNRL